MSTELPPLPLPGYPPARRQDLVELLHGRRVADPYRWLEDAESEESHAWTKAQDELARTALDRLPGRQWLRSRIDDLLSIGVTGPPVWRGSRQFFMRRTAEQDYPVLHVTDPDGSDRVLLNPAALDPTGRTTLDAWHPDPSGRRLAYQISVGGEGNSSLYVLDTDSGAILEGPIPRCRRSPIAWLPTGDGYYYVRSLPPYEAPSGEQPYHRRVYLHHVGTDPDTADHLIFGADAKKTATYTLGLSSDGRWLTVTCAQGTAHHNDIWIADLSQSPPEHPHFIPVQEGIGAHTSSFVGPEGRLYLHTDHEAPHRKLAVADHPGSGPGEWTDLLAEDPHALLQHIAILNGAQLEHPLLIAGWQRHSISEISVHDLRTGERLEAIPTPGLGTVGEIRGSGHTVWFTYTDPFTPVSVYRWDARTHTTALWASPPGKPAADSAASTAQEGPGLMRQITCASADGTPVRITVISLHGRAEPRPTILNGYGGFGLSSVPLYSPDVLAWVEAGGIFATAHVRGGGEEGTEWHQAGSRATKQNSIDDFHAAAEALISGGWTTHNQLVTDGGSSGGLLVGAALVQRPDLYRAAVCTAPLLDMVRYEQSGLGPSWTAEYGSAAVQEELDWLLSYSPYHNIEKGTDYPALLLTVSDGDGVVDPLHARKMCAALQHVAGGQPDDSGRSLVLLRRETDVGHGSRTMTRAVELIVDQLSFAAWQAGLRLPQ